MLINIYSKETIPLNVLTLIYEKVGYSLRLDFISSSDYRFEYFMRTDEFNEGGDYYVDILSDEELDNLEKSENTVKESLLKVLRDLNINFRYLVS